MRGVEGKPQVAFQQFKAGLPGNNGVLGSGAGERWGQQGSAINGVRGLIARQRQLNLPNIDGYCIMWMGLAALTVNSPIAAEVRIPVTPAIQQIIVQVGRGLDFVLFHKISKEQRGSILRELTELRQEEGIDRFVLTYEEGLGLRDAAAVVNVAYDPGTPEEVVKRTFKFSDLEANASPEAIALRNWYASKGI